MDNVDANEVAEPTELPDVDEGEDVNVKGTEDELEGELVDPVVTAGVFNAEETARVADDADEDTDDAVLCGARMLDSGLFTIRN